MEFLRYAGLLHASWRNTMAHAAAAAFKAVELRCEDTLSSPVLVWGFGL